MEITNHQTADGQHGMSKPKIDGIATNGLNVVNDYTATWALYYQSIGLSVFPLNGKIPCVPWKQYQTKAATKEEIIELWTRFPFSNIGMVTGTITQRLVLDVDGPTGEDSIKNLPIPPTQTVRTRRGVQYHFRWSAKYTGKTTVAGLLPGIDVRGEGGMVVLPPSLCSDGTRYEFHKGKSMDAIPLAEAPEWLQAKLVQTVEQKIAPTAKENNWIEGLLDGVGTGDRHEGFVKLAGYYFNCMHPDVAAQHLREWNSRNTPPMEDIEDKIADMKKRFEKGEYESKFLEKKAAEPKDLTLVTATELIKQNAHRPEYLADRLIPMGSSVIFAGWQGLGKTFVATDLAIEVSKKTGSGLWLGEFPVKKGPVLWIDNEMGGGLTSYRLRQLLGAKNLQSDDLNLYYHARNRLKLTSEKHYMQLRNEIDQIRPVLVVIDSMASCHTLSENEASDMRHFFDDLVAPLCEEFKCVMMFVDHERKAQPGANVTGGQRLRGSGAKGDSVDAILSLDKKEDMLIFEHSKARYSKRMDPFVIDILDVPSGVVVKKREMV